VKPTPSQASTAGLAAGLAAGPTAGPTFAGSGTPLRATRAEWSESTILILKRLLSPLRAITASMNPPRILLGLLFVASIMAAGGLWDSAARALGTTQLGPGGLITVVDGVAIFAPDVEGMSGDGSRGLFESTVDAVTLASVQAMRAILAGNPADAIHWLRALILDVPLTLWRVSPTFVILFGLPLVVLISLLGGAVSRIAAVEQASGVRLGTVEALRFSGESLVRTVAAHLIPLALLGALAVVMAVAGALLLVPVLNLLVALAAGLLLLLGFLGVVLGLLTIVSMPLSCAAVACDDSDAADSTQRTFAYCLQRPVQCIALHAITLMGAAVGYAVIATVVALALSVTGGLLGVWGAEPAGALTEGVGPFAIQATSEHVVEGATVRGSSAILGFWRTVCVGLVAGWTVSYLFSAWTFVYLALREAVDGQEPEDVRGAGAAAGRWEAGRADA